MRTKIRIAIYVPLVSVLLVGCASPWRGEPERTSPFGKKTSASSKDSRSEIGEYGRLMAKAHNLEDVGEVEKLREIYKKLTKEFPDRPEPYHRLGVVADRQRRHREAQELFTKALNLDPRNAEIFNDLGYCLFLQGKMDKAESALLKAVSLDESSSRYRNNLGMVYAHQDRFDDAMEHFRRAGSEADAQYNLAFVLASKDNFEGAQRCFQMALAADPTHEKAIHALRSFQQTEEKSTDHAEITRFEEEGNWVYAGAPDNQPAGPESQDQDFAAAASTALAESPESSPAPSRKIVGPRMPSAAARAMKAKARSMVNARTTSLGPTGDSGQ